MENPRETQEMIEVEEMRAEHAQKLQGLSPNEKLRLLKEEAEAARKELGLNLPKAKRPRTAV